MKRLFAFLSLISLSVVLQAAIVPLEQARDIAKNVYFERANLSFPVGYKDISFSDEIIVAENAAPLLYVFNVSQSRGFIIISAESNVYPVLAYTKKGSFGQGKVPPAFEWWMSLYKTWVKEVRAENRAATAEISEAWERYDEMPDGSNKATTIGPLVTTKWDQGGYYNDSCPGGSVTGCVATMMAQIMRYWSHPTQGESSYSYVHPSYGIQAANFGATTYHWENMPDIVSSPNADVAQLMYHCGVSVDMSYSPGGSGANMGRAASAYMTYFKYSYFGINIMKSGYSDAAWKVRLRADLIDGRPISYAGGSHAFICDGFEYPDHFHFNFGWGGSYDGYFYITSIGNGGSYSYNQQIVCNIYPAEPSVSSAQSTLSSAQANDPIPDVTAFTSLEGSFLVYPNPATDEVHFDVKSTYAGTLVYRIIDISGRVVFESSRKKDHLPSSWSIDLGQLDSGIYTISLSNEFETVNQKLVIQ